MHIPFIARLSPQNSRERLPSCTADKHRPSAIQTLHYLLHYRVFLLLEVLLKFMAELPVHLIAIWV